MKATELRIGNLVNNKEGNIVYVNPNHLIVLAYGIENVFKPIPLTEEWLLKFEFEKNQSPNKDIQVGLVNDDFANNVMSVVWRGFILVKIQYVHQLQNLFYSITKEELTPKI